MTENIAIQTRDISKYFGNFKALNNLSISVPQGEIFGFIGKNGAGKTTFMRIICGLIKPNGGKFEIRNRISFLPQNVKFQDNIDALELLRFFVKLRKCELEESIKLAKVLEVDLSRKIKDLSPGQQRKLQLVITTVGAPEILVLDEPTAGLDPTGVQQIREIIRLLNRRGCTIFISSHVLNELENLCHTIAVIEKGELLYQGGCGTVYEIETDGIDEKSIKRLFQLQNRKFNAEGNILVVEIERHEVPFVLGMLYENNIKVFGVRQQGIETLYNRLVMGCF